MPALPSYIEAHMNESILGRAKLKLYELVSGQPQWLPEDIDVGRFIRKEFRKNPVAGRIWFTLLTEIFQKRISFSELLPVKDILALVKRIEQEALDDQNVLEVNNCPKLLPKVSGVCIHREGLANEGQVYVITLFDDAEFPKSILGRLEIRASSINPQPIFSVWTGEDYEYYDENDYSQSWLADLGIRLLLYLDQNRPVTLAPLSQINDAEFSEDSVHKPPKDKRLTTYIAAAINNKLACTSATVPLDKIRPFSLDFCLRYPKETVRWEVEEIQKGAVAPMIVYWEKDHFVMSDDYSAYLAHRFLKSETVLVVIVGEFPADVVVEDVTLGGPELIPPLRIMQTPDYDSLAPEIKEWLIDARLHRKETSPVAATLAAVAMVLSEILFNDATDEKQIHEFLSQYPVIIDPHGSSMRSELRLGSEYRVDLAIQYNLDDKKLLLIELEHPNVPIFTAKGRPRAHVTHALQQVEDWLQWWREHPNDVPQGLDPAIPVEGLVVIGRNKDLSEQDKRRLLHLNSTRDVKLITYDELLEKLEVLIQNLETLSK
jgi:hypothetical protein